MVLRSSESDGFTVFPELLDRVIVIMCRAYFAIGESHTSLGKEQRGFPRSMVKERTWLKAKFIGLDRWGRLLFELWGGVRFYVHAGSQ